MKRLLPILVICLLAAIAMPLQARADDSELSSASELIADGSALVMYGSLSALAASGEAVVTSVETAADGSIIVLAGVSDAAGATLKLSGNAARGLSVAAGSAIEVTALSTGHLLVASGAVIAFIPNEIGKALLHQSRVSAQRD